jgi:L-alanine-DL-glutamate epimerase-like enolase superfamily enzyme
VRIAEMRVHVVSVPFTEPETWRFGRLWGLTSAIVELRTDAGLVGWGETPGSPTIGLVTGAIETLRPLVVGADPHDVTAFVRLARLRGVHHYPYLGNAAVAAIEIALWDVVGKAAGLPVSRLWGGATTSAVPFYRYLPVQDRQPATAAAEARSAVGEGYGTVYLKLGIDLQTDLAIVAAVREAIGDAAAIRVDANEAWSRFEALRVVPRLGALGVEFVEQPIDMHDLDGLAELRARTGVPIGANQSAWLPHQVVATIARGAGDVIVTDPHQLGGLSTFRDVAALCELHGLPLIKHAFGDLGVTTAASLHVLGSLPEPQLGHQTHLQILEHDLLSERLTFAGGCLPVPTAPGIGVEVDRDALRHYGEVYESIGEYEGYSPIDSERPQGRK